ncbi:tetraacyldisaccharide 4'-kinase [Candidatus Pelagibacter sp.]|jgi:tetraacyldisaccharide 4'-kinase|nr:tetraacyldisaccharide 4'-kinase [Candidatus Pelagibacter sp.]
MMIKKPKFWDYKKPSFISFLLTPLTIPIRLNNFFLNYSSKIKPRKIFSICIGNIYLGGTGKTPTTIKLYQILNSIFKGTVTAKKFYTSQYDEIILLKRKTKFVIGDNRSEIINKAINRRKKIIIFDDGLQDKGVNYNLKFVCFDSFNWIGNGQLIPSGPLREKLNSLKKFDAVFLKNMTKTNYKITSLIKAINPKIKIFNSKYKIKNLNKFNLSNKYLIFSGIGSPDNFKKLLKKYKFNIIDDVIFPDHHIYNNNDILKIIKKADELKAKIITTEKDFVKISKIYHNKISFIDIDLDIDKKQKLIDFLKIKINA